MSYITLYLLIGIAWTCFTIKETIELFYQQSEDKHPITIRLALLILLILNVLGWPKEIYDKIFGRFKK